MIICPHCSRENEDHYKFCLGCGSQLPKPEAKKPEPEPEQPRMIACPHCSTPVPSNFKFCGACGGPIAAASPTAATAPQQPSDFGASPVNPASATTSAASTGSQHPNVGGFNDEESTSRHAVPSQLAQDSTPSIGSAVAKLVVIRPDGSEGATIPLREGEVVIGRSSEQETLSGDPFLSPRHAAIVSSNGRFTIRDMDSLNGIFRRIRGEQELASGDFVRLGQELLLFERMEDVKPLPSGNPGDGETQRGGSPDIGYWGRLSLIGGPDLTSRAFLFSDDEINIGREIGDIVFRDDGFVSGRHARISKVNGKVILKDLGSSNGTYIKVRNQHEVKDGDLILMGQQLFRLVA